MNAYPQAEKSGLLDRLERGPVICAEGYVFELERRGYLQAGGFVPEVVLEHPDVVSQVHRELVRAGSDVIEAFTYYGHREKLRLIGKEHLLEPLNRRAIELAHAVAAEDHGQAEAPLVAGNICNTNVYHPDGSSDAQVRAMFEEQVGWAIEGGVDLVIAETFIHLGEARLALEAIRRAGLPAVVTFALPYEGTLIDGWTAPDACAVLEAEGAAVVGLNCHRGPATILAPLREIRQRVSCHVAGLPVPYRTHEGAPTFLHFDDPQAGALPHARPFPTALDPFTCNRYELGRFAEQAVAMDVRYVGICCGNSPVHTRAMAEALGRHPEASAYSPDMTKHFAFGDDPTLDEENRSLSSRL